MSTLKISFALEGESDKATIPILVKRIVSDYFSEIPLDLKEVRRPRRTGHGFIIELPNFAYKIYTEGAHMLVAVIDTDSPNPKERLKLLREAKQKCEKSLPLLLVAEGLAVQKLEAWLLADEAAIWKVFDGDRASIQFPSPEKDPNPKDTLNRIVRRLTHDREISYVASATELANAIRLDILRQKCSHFDEFAKNLIDCVREWQRLNAPRN